MALPGDVTTFTLTFGAYTDGQGAAALAGATAKLFPVDPSTNRRLRVDHAASGQRIVPVDVTVTILDDGTATVAGLPHTGQASLTPSGWAWRVEWNLTSTNPAHPGNLTFVVPSGATVDFDLLVPAATVPPVSLASPTVFSVAGFTGTVTGANLATGLDAAGNRLSDAALRAAFGAPWRYAQGAAFGRALRTGLTHVGVQCLGDSTADGTGEWFDLFMRWLAEEFPAYTVSYRTFSDTTQAYSLPTIIQTGADGDRWFRNSSSATYFTTPDSAATSPTGDLDVRIKMSHDTWAPASAFALAGKFGGSGFRSWRFELNPTGTIMFGISTDGANTPGATSTVAVPFTAGQTGWVRATIDVDNGAGGNTVTFYTSTDGVTWTQLGATGNVGAGTTSIFDSTQTTQFIGRGGGGNSLSATYYHLQVLSGLGASAVPIIDFDLDVWPLGGTGAQTSTDHCGNVWTLAGSTETRGGSPGLSFMNGSVGGKVATYASNGTRFPKLTPIPCALTFLSYSHNNGAVLDIRTDYKDLADLLVAKWPDTGIVATSQNPRIAPAGNIADHAIRGQVIASLAGAQGWPFLDVQRAFNDHADTASLINAADGVHTTAAGSQVWADLVETLVRPWLR